MNDQHKLSAPVTAVPTNRVIPEWIPAVAVPSADLDALIAKLVAQDKLEVES